MKLQKLPLLIGLIVLAVLVVGATLYSQGYLFKGQYGAPIVQYPRPANFDPNPGTGVNIKLASTNFQWGTGYTSSTTYYVKPSLCFKNTTNNLKYCLDLTADVINNYTVTTASWKGIVESRLQIPLNSQTGQILQWNVKNNYYRKDNNQFLGSTNSVPWDIFVYYKDANAPISTAPAL